MADAVPGTVWLETIVCCKCGIAFGVPNHWRAMRLERHDIFYCPNGHGQAYLGETKAQKFRRLYENEQKRREWAQQGEKRARHAEAVAKGKLKAQSQRVKAGVCPCCKRTFQQLARHMSCKHPDWSESDG